MKTLAVLLIGVMLAIGGLAYAGFGEPEDEVSVFGEVVEATFECPVSRLSDNSKCMDCHQMVLKDGKPTFGLKEVLLSASYEQKPFDLKIQRENGEVVGYYYRQYWPVSAIRTRRAKCGKCHTWTHAGISDASTSPRCGGSRRNRPTTISAILP